MERVPLVRGFRFRLQNQFAASVPRWSVEPAAWLKPNLTEPRVRLAVDDWCRPGDVAFDVGANFGLTAVMMSRRAGPRGVVCAFEANPRIAQIAQDRLVKSGCANVQVYNRAIYSRSHERIALYLSQNMVADSVVNRTDTSITVETLALDDFVHETGLAPRFVKMDIEGAEPDALIGFEQTIAQHRPVMILEQSPGDLRCLEFLAHYGYLAIDLGAYERLDPAVGLKPGVVVSDVLFVMPEHLAGTPYADLTQLPVFEIESDAFIAEGASFTTAPRAMAAGRYVADAAFSASGSQELYCGVRVNGEVVMTYHGRSSDLTGFAPIWNFELATEALVEFFFDFAQEPDPTFAVKRLDVRRLASFSGRPPVCR